jgi:hypothetical protein
MRPRPRLSANQHELRPIDTRFVVKVNHEYEAEYVVAGHVEQSRGLWREDLQRVGMRKIKAK